MIGRMLIIAGLELFLIVFPGLFKPGHAQLLDYGEFSGYGLMKGILGNDYSNPIAACITGKESILPASKTAIRAHIVTSSFEYMQAFHIDQKAEASFLGIGGGGTEFNFGQNTDRSGIAFDIIIEAYSENDGKTVDNIKWEKKYADLLSARDEGKTNEVRKQCGDRYIQTVFNESRLFAVLHVSNQKSSTLTQFNGKVTGGISLDIGSVNGRLGGDSNVRSANQNGAIAVEIFSVGLGGIAVSAQILKLANTDGLQQIADKLADKLTELKPKGQPVRYRLAALPGFEGGDLSDSRLLRLMTNMKAAYQETEGRIENIEALQNKSDKRRTLLLQPEADKNAKGLRAKLIAYRELIKEAHQTCRTTRLLSNCEKAVDSAGPAPTRLNLELPRIGPPGTSFFQLFINGEPLLPGDNSSFVFAEGESLLNAAKKIRPNAESVDVLSVVDAPFMARIELLVLRPNPTALPSGVGSRQLRPSELMLPKNWKGGQANLALHLVHADNNHPCPISKSSAGLSIIDSDCLTPTGHILKNVAMANAAQYVITRQPVKRHSIFLMGVMTDCFGFFIQRPLGDISLDLSDKDASSLGAQVNVFFPMGDRSFTLASQEEFHSLKEWESLVQQWLAIPKTPLEDNRSNCVAHIK